MGMIDTFGYIMIGLPSEYLFLSGACRSEIRNRESFWF